jgi:hypothetical protein
MACRSRSPAFGGNNITTPLIVLFVWLVAGAAVMGYLGRIRPA